MANSFSVNTKKILHSLGAIVDGAYLWAGADKGIQSEMQGKNNGVTIHYTITDMGDATDSALTFTSNEVGGFSQTTANSIIQRDVDVTIRDSRVVLDQNAFQRMVTSRGEVEAHINIGQKLAKKAINAIMPDDIASIGNVFVGDGYQAYQTAGAYLKSYTEGKLYGFMDWNAWGKLTANGQQAVPCNLARPEFGNQLVGKWSLIDELRVIPDIPVKEMISVAGTIGAKIDARAAASAAVSSLSITSTGAIAAGKTVVFQIPGLYNSDCNGTKAGLYTFTYTASSSVSAGGTFTVAIPVGTIAEADIASGTAIKSLISSDGAGTYFGCIIRAEGAQCFGSANDVSCKTAKYAKESYEGFTVHTNEDSDVLNFKDVKRWDLVYASKLVEPRAAAMVWLKV